MNLFNTETAFQKIERYGGTPVKIEEEDYYEALEVLPPIYLKGASWFAMGEAHSHAGNGEPRHHCFARICGEFYGLLGTRSEAEERFEKLQEKNKGEIDELVAALDGVR
jgi:hypothetical protein